jgi:cofilin
MAHVASGVRINEECKLKFTELQRRKTYRYIILKIDEKVQEVIVEKTGGPDESYDTFCAALPENDPRYGVFDLDFVTEENRPLSKIFFIAWSPETSRVKAKMMYASSKETCRRALEGVHYEIQATDATEMDVEVIKERIK